MRVTFSQANIYKAIERGVFYIALSYAYRLEVITLTFLKMNCF